MCCALMEGGRDLLRLKNRYGGMVGVGVGVVVVVDESI